MPTSRVGVGDLVPNVERVCREIIRRAPIDRITMPCRAACAMRARAVHDACAWPVPWVCTTDVASGRGEATEGCCAGGWDCRGGLGGGRSQGSCTEVVC